MRRAHFPRGSPPGQSNHQVTGYGVSLGTPSAVLNAGLTDGHGGARTQTSSRPTNSYPSRHVFSGDGDNLVIHRGASEESEHTSHFRFTSLCPSPPMTHRISHRPAIEVQGQENASSSRQATLNVTLGMPQSAAGPNEGMSQVTAPPEAVQSTYGDMDGSWRRGHERLTSANAQPNYAGHHAWSDPVDARQLPVNNSNWRSPGPSQVRSAPALLSNYASGSGSGPHQNRVEYERDALAQYLSRGVSFFHTQPQILMQAQNPSTATGYASPQRGEDGGTPGSHGYAELSDIPAAGNRGVEDENLAGPSGRTARIRRPREAVDPEEAVPTARKRARRSNPGGQSPTTLPVIPIVFRGSRQFKMMPQTPYRSAVRQDGWIPQPPIEFEWLKLADAENPNHTGIPGYNEKMFGYGNVGGSILCRLNFSGREIGRWKITTTNHRNTPVPITKGKLVYEVAKLVKRCIERIKAQRGCGGATFENAVLTKLCHVSRSSWQPELWYEVTTPGRNSP